MKTDNAIRQALAHLPRSLSKTYHRLLQISPEMQQPYQRETLELVFTAHRPLSVDEIREALSVTPGDAVWGAANQINDISGALKCCSAPLTIDEEEATVRFMHHSVKQFLQKDFGVTNDELRPSNYGKFSDQADSFMGSVIMTYLSYGIFGSEISQADRSDSAIQIEPSAVIDSTLKLVLPTRMAAMKFLSTRRSFVIDIDPVPEAYLKNIQTTSEFRFYSYAVMYWQGHITAVLSSRKCLTLLRKLLKRQVIKIDALNIEHSKQPWVEDAKGILTSVLLQQDTDIDARYEWVGCRCQGLPGTITKQLLDYYCI